MGSTIKILMLQLYSNGDCLYATAVARQIKNDYKDCHLTWGIASFCKNIILENPYVDEVMEINDVAKNDADALRKLRRLLEAKQKAGEYDHFFFIHNGDTNQAYYDGSIRSSILRAYQRPITVPIIPVLHLTDSEKAKALKFAEHHDLFKYRHVILFEFAPQSGQSKMTPEDAVSISKDIVKNNDAVVILSSANKVNSGRLNIIDGSSLTLRETAALTHYCTFLLGSSSGITWISTADSAKQLPMVQLLSADAVWINPISRDFERFGFSTEKLIELTEYKRERVVECVRLALKDFDQAKQRYNQLIPLHFKSTRNIVYNLLCYLELSAILTHVKVNQEVYGHRIAFYKEVLLGFVIFPFRLISNKIKKARY